MIDVTVVTRLAVADEELSERDYAEIFAELRERMPLRRFVELISSAYSIAWWSKFEKGEVTLTRQGRQELRRAVGLPALPLTVGEALADVDPDATVVRLGSGRPDRVLAIGEDAHEPLLLRLNGAVAPVECTAEIWVCGCGVKFVKRSWNQRRCAGCRRKG